MLAFFISAVAMPRSNHILVKLAGTFLILCCAACNPKHDAVRRDMNGFVLGDDSRPPPVFAIGVGDGLERFYEKNAFLKAVKPVGPLTKLSMPLLKNIDATYDDGAMRFHLGCATTTNIEGSVAEGGISMASFYLCNPAIDDWYKATHDVEALIRSFALQNKHLQSLRAFRQHHSFDETSAYFETRLLDRFTGHEFPLSELEANRFFKDAADGGHVQELVFLQGSGALLEAFANEKVVVFFEIAKRRYWGGDNLSDAQRRQMKYLAVVTFRRREHAEAP